MKYIIRFTGKFKFLSNFFMKPVIYNGKEYPSAEHAFQAQKTTCSRYHNWIQQSETPGEAKKFGRAAPLRKDWKKVKFDIMREILRAKFSDKKLKIKLLETEDAILIEGNNWRDREWGVDITGENKLGELLMEIREELKII